MPRNVKAVFMVCIHMRNVCSDVEECRDEKQLHSTARNRLQKLI